MVTFRDFYLVSKRVMPWHPPHRTAGRAITSTPGTYTQALSRRPKPVAEDLGEEANEKSKELGGTVKVDYVSFLDLLPFHLKTRLFVVAAEDL